MTARQHAELLAHLAANAAREGVALSDAHCRELERAMPADWRLSESGFAELFVARHGHRLRYVAQMGKWFEFDGARWHEDRTVRVYDLVREFVRRDTEELDLPRNQKRAFGTAATVAGIERIARAFRAVAAVPEEFDADPWVLNTPVGIVDLTTGELREHDPAARCTKSTAVAPGGERPARWCRFLLEVLEGDEELIAFVQRLAGYTLTASTREHVFALLWGTGANGKSTLLGALRGILGEYAMAAPSEVFMQSHTDRHPTELAVLRGARMVISQEVDEGRRWNESRIKALTGGDPIVARYMRQDPFEFQPAFKLWIGGNHRPQLVHIDEAMRRRLLLIPFTATIPPDSRDPDLGEKLREEWPGIFTWMVEGCLAYRDWGLRPPERVRAATDDYFEAQDAFADWLEENCELGNL